MSWLYRTYNVLEVVENETGEVIHREKSKPKEAQSFWSLIGKASDPAESRTESVQESSTPQDSASITIEKEESEPLEQQEPKVERDIVFDGMNPVEDPKESKEDESNDIGQGALSQENVLENQKETLETDNDTDENREESNPDEQDKETVDNIVEKENESETDTVRIIFNSDNEESKEPQTNEEDDSQNKEDKPQANEEKEDEPQGTKEKEHELQENEEKEETHADTEPEESTEDYQEKEEAKKKWTGNLVDGQPLDLSSDSKPIRSVLNNSSRASRVKTSLFDPK